MKGRLTFRQATSLADSVEWERQFRLFGSLETLLRRSFSSVCSADWGSLLLDIVNLPLPDERGIQGQADAKGMTPQHEWPELMLHLPKDCWTSLRSSGVCISSCCPHFKDTYGRWVDRKGRQFASLIFIKCFCSLQKKLNRLERLSGRFPSSGQFFREISLSPTRRFRSSREQFGGTNETIQE